MLVYIPAIINKTKNFFMRRPLSLMLFLLSSQIILFAQSRQIKGTVKDADGNGVFASVTVQGTRTTTPTNENGEFFVSIPSGSAILEISSIGFETKIVNVSSSENELVIILDKNEGNLGEVVVTALGIRRDKKTLAYSSQQVDGSELRKTAQVNFMDAMSGKVAGIDIKISSSGAGGSTRAILRGNRSLTGLSEPLYVIDGIPMVNNKGGQPGMWGGNDRGDGLSQINPDDIESINVLKGANASILYGSQGANGVVLITTKKGKEGRAMISFNSSATFDKVNDIPQLQFRYGSEGGATESWSTTKGTYPSNYVQDFFQTGRSLINSIAVSKGNSNTQVYFSYANTYATGVIPNNKYLKNNLGFKQSTKLFNDKVTIGSNIILAAEQTNNRPTSGYYLNPLTALYMFPRERDFESFKNNYQIFNKERNMYLQNWFVNNHFQSNPYWVINKEPKLDKVQRAIASLQLDYDIVPHLKAMVRGNYDYAVRSFDQRDAAGSNTTNVSSNGRWDYTKYTDKSGYFDGILTYNNIFGKFSLNALAGASYQESIFGDGVTVNNGVTPLLYPNEFSFQNIPPNVMISSIYGGRRIKQGLFGNMQFGFNEAIFLDLAGRNDWSSTLAGTGNQSYFYPAVGISAIISQLVKMPEPISYFKVRASNSTTANDVPFNVVRPNNSIGSALGGINPATQVPFTNLKPEKIKSTELGGELRFFKSRLGFDVTYYNSVSTNQFLTLPAPSGSGYTFYYVNAGKIVNKGLELTLDAEPVRSENFTWKTVLNYSRNRNKIVELIPEQPGYQVELGSSEGYTSVVRAGGSINDLWVFKFKRNDQGQIMLGNNSAPLKTDKREFIGNLNPDYSLGWNNNLYYKDFALNFLITGKFGGKVFSQTESILDGAGVTERTAAARDIGYVAINAIKGTEVVTQLDPKIYYQAVGDRNGIGEAYVFDKTNIRLSQLSLTYNLNVNRLKLPIKDAAISLIGRNLFFFSKKAPFDPEMAFSTDLNSQSLDNFMVPSTKTYGINLKLTF